MDPRRYDYRPVVHQQEKANVTFDPTQFGTGWAAEHEDRNALHATAKPFSVPHTFSAPEEIDLRKFLPIQSQGSVGSCVGFTLAEAAQTCNWWDTGGQVVNCSAMWCYLRAQKRCGLFGRDQGATIQAAMEVGRDEGICLEEFFPYPGEYETEIPAKASEAAKPHKILRHSMLDGYQNCVDWLATGQGVILAGVRWTRACSQCTGILADAGGGGGGGHAVGLVGYSPRLASDGRKYLWLRNHWGTDWANKGWAEVAPRVIDQWSEDEYTELCGLSDIEEYGFRKLPNWTGLFA